VHPVTTGHDHVTVLEVQCPVSTSTTFSTQNNMHASSISSIEHFSTAIRFWVQLPLRLMSAFFGVWPITPIKTNYYPTNIYKGPTYHPEAYPGKTDSDHPCITEVILSSVHSKGPSHPKHIMHNCLPFYRIRHQHMGKTYWAPLEALCHRQQRPCIWRCPE